MAGKRKQEELLRNKKIIIGITLGAIVLIGLGIGIPFMLNSISNPFDHECPECPEIEKATIFVSIDPGKEVIWKWNQSTINSSIEINRFVGFQFIPFRFIQKFIDTFRNIANWFDNETGESYWNSEDDNNIPELDFSCLENAEMFSKSISIQCDNEYSKNFSLYFEQIEPLIITSISYGYKNETELEHYLDNDGDYTDNRSSVNFAFPLFNNEDLFSGLFSLLFTLPEPITENQTIVDYFNNTFFPDLYNFLEPYTIDLEPGDTFNIEVGDFVVNQDETIYNPGEDYSNFLHSIEMNMNGTGYICFSDGVSVVP